MVNTAINQWQIFTNFFKVKQFINEKFFKPGLYKVLNLLNHCGDPELISVPDGILKY